jgi:dTDP-4-amino-4,6-dideoxygalactose transaminase
MTRRGSSAGLSIRWHGTDAVKKESIRVGVNGRLDFVQCAVLLSKLTVFADEMKARDRIAQRYRQGLGSACSMQRVSGRLARTPGACSRSWSENRADIMKRLQEKGSHLDLLFQGASPAQSLCGPCAQGRAAGLREACRHGAEPADASLPDRRAGRQDRRPR